MRRHTLSANVISAHAKHLLESAAATESKFEDEDEEYEDSFESGKNRLFRKAKAKRTFFVQ